MGCIGLARRDFETLTPPQFEAIYDQWRLRQESLMHERWEQARFTAYYALRPHCKALKLTDIISFDWDKVPEKRRKEEKSTKERFDYINSLWNNGK